MSYYQFQIHSDGANAFVVQQSDADFNSLTSRSLAPVQATELRTMIEWSENYVRANLATREAMASELWLTANDAKSEAFLARANELLTGVRTGFVAGEVEQ